VQELEPVFFVLNIAVIRRQRSDLYWLLNQIMLFYTPASVSRFFIDIKSFRSHYVPGVDSDCNINEYQEYFLRVKAAGA